MTTLLAPAATAADVDGFNASKVYRTVSKTRALAFDARVDGVAHS